MLNQLVFLECIQLSDDKLSFYALLNFSLHFFFFRMFFASALLRSTWVFLSFYSLLSITKEIIYISWIGKYSLLLLRSLGLELLPCWIFHWTLPVNSLGPAIFSEGEFWTTDNLSNSYFLTDFGNFLKVFCSFHLIFPMSLTLKLFCISLSFWSLLPL